MDNLDKLIDSVADTIKCAPASMERVSPVPGLVAHCDGDGMAYLCAGKDTMPAAQARMNIIRRAQKVRRLTGATKVIMHLTCPASDKGGRGFAAEFKPYQGNRRGSKKPKNWQAARDAMMMHDGRDYLVKVWNDREADDGIAYWSDVPRKRGTDTLHVIHADDKDMRMFAGIHLNWRTFHVTTVPHGAFEVQGDDGLLYGHKWFWTQMILGDSIDNIPGLPGCGPKAAEILDDTHDNTAAYAAVERLYRARMGDQWHTHMAEQAVLLWMRQDASAAIDNFLSLGVFPDEVADAAAAISGRVAEHRRALEALNE